MDTMTPRPAISESLAAWVKEVREQGHAEGLIECAATHGEIKRRARARAIFELDRGADRAFRAGERRGVVRALVVVGLLGLAALALRRRP